MTILVSAEPRLELKDFYERAAITLLDILDTQRDKNLGVKTLHDDRRLMRLWKTKPPQSSIFIWRTTRKINGPFEMMKLPRVPLFIGL
jgi:hypothetical protein